MATPHINAEPTDFAPAVLMPGDPRRAQRIAESVLESPAWSMTCEACLASPGPTRASR